MKNRGKKNNFGIKAIIFDMNGVLAIGVNKKQKSFSKSFHELMAKSLKINVDTWVDSIDSVYADSIEGKVSEQKVSETISKNLNINKKKLEKIILKNYKKIFKHNKQLFKQALKLKKFGYEIAILSDQWAYSKKVFIDKKTKKFNPVIVSCDVGMRKPNPKIYELTLKKLKLPAKNCLFIDNRDWNIKPAKKLGMKTILFKNNKQLFENKIWKDVLID